MTLPSGTPTGGIAFVSSKRGFATGYGHCGGEIWATSDGGSTWHVVAGSCTGDGLTSLDFPTGTVGFAVGGQYLKFANNQDLVVLKTTDAGRRWVTVYKNSVPGSSALDANPFGEVAFFDDEDGLALDGGQTMGGNGPVGGHLWRTTDGGRHWSELGVTGLRLVLDGRNDAWLVEGGAGGGGDVLWRSLDRGGTWSPVGNGSLVGVEAIAGSGARLWVWTEAGGFLSTDGGRTWKVPPAAMEKALTSTWPGVPVQLAADGTVVVGPGWAGDDSYWLSSDGGLTGRLFSLPTLAKVGMTAISFSDPQHGLALGSPYGCDQAQVLATSDGGTCRRQVGTTDLGSISALSYDGAVAVGVNTGCYRNSVIISDNSGRTWSEVANERGVWPGFRVRPDGGHGLFQLTRIWGVRPVQSRLGPPLAKGRPQPAWRSILRGRNWPFHNMGVRLTRGAVGNLRQRSTLAGRPAEAAPVALSSQSTLLNHGAWDRRSWKWRPRADRVTFSGSDCLTASR